MLYHPDALYTAGRSSLLLKVKVREMKGKICKSEVEAKEGLLFTLRGMSVEVLEWRGVARSGAE